MATSPRSIVTVPPVAVTDRLHFPSLEPVRIGMPELCLTGLSETWLLKACGHRHWLALAHAHGQKELTFRNMVGERLYPAFTSVSIANARLDLACEDDILTFETTLSRSGRTRYQSRIVVRSGAAEIAVLAMATAFIRRENPTSNRGVARSAVARPCRLLPSAPRSRPDFAADPDEWQDFPTVNQKSIVLTPSPYEDFNGAGFLYFAAFQTMIDRAERQWFPPVEGLFRTTLRQIRYSGNIEPGEDVHARLIGCRRDDTGLAHWVTLSRATDNQEIARCFSRRESCLGAMPGAAS